MSNGRRTVGIAVGLLALLSACGVEEAPASAKIVTFENKEWGIRLEYPGDWEARAGDGAEPLIVELTAPGRKGTVGAGVTVVGAWSAAALEVVAVSFERKLRAEGEVATAELYAGGRPARSFEYRLRRKGGWVRTRTVVIQGPEHYFFVNFSAYDEQYETARPYFEAVERSLDVY